MNRRRIESNKMKLGSEIGNEKGTKNLRFGGFIEEIGTYRNQAVGLIQDEDHEAAHEVAGIIQAAELIKPAHT